MVYDPNNTNIYTVSVPKDSDYNLEVKTASKVRQGLYKTATILQDPFLMVNKNNTIETFFKIRTPDFSNSDVIMKLKSRLFHNRTFVVVLEEDYEIGDNDNFCKPDPNFKWKDPGSPNTAESQQRSFEETSVAFTNDKGTILETLPVCKDFLRRKCKRNQSRNYVHLSDSHVEVKDNKLTVCKNALKGQCHRPVCKFHHTPSYQLQKSGVSAQTIFHEL